MAFGPMALAQTALSAIPLFVGENNIFSGKQREATRELGKTFRASQAMENVPAEIARVAQQRQMRASQGLSGTALGLYKQRQNAALGSGMQALRYQRPGSALAGTGALVGQGMQGAAEIALADEQARERNRMLSEQTQMDVGRMSQQEQLRKLNEQAQYWTTRKQEAVGTQMGALQGMASALGSSQRYDAYAGKSEKGLFDKSPSSQATPAQANIYGMRPSSSSVNMPTGMFSAMSRPSYNAQQNLENLLSKIPATKRTR